MEKFKIILRVRKENENFSEFNNADEGTEKETGEVEMAEVLRNGNVRQYAKEKSRERKLTIWRVSATSSEE